jgi:hypothetical protein
MTMDYVQLLSYAIQGIRAALKALGAYSQASAILQTIDDNLTAMQAEGRNPTEAERAAIAAILDDLVKQPAQGA